MELQQSSLYRQYVKTLGWQVIAVDSTQIFLRHIPLQGTMAKIQRPQHLPAPDIFIPILKKHKVRTVVAEAAAHQNEEEFIQWVDVLRKHVQVSSTPYIPTKTILIDLTPSEKNIFNSFTEAKRRAVRRALKNNVSVKESTHIDDLIKIKNKSAGFLGFLTTFGIKKLWPIFGEKNAAILLAETSEKKIVGGVLLLFWQHVSYYWIAGATREGKKLFAPTLLVWEALRLSKKREAKQFDFVGVWDERLPRKYDSWKGFTKFKEGFGGKTIYYPISMLHK